MSPATSKRSPYYGSVPHPHGVEFTITTEGAVEPAHLCFRAPDRAAVRAFHAAALAVGRADDGSAGKPCVTRRMPSPRPKCTKEPQKLLLFDRSAEPINRDSSELRDSYLGLAR